MNPETLTAELESIRNAARGATGPSTPGAATPAPLTPGHIELGRSRQDRPVYGWKFGHGPIRVGLIGGCHADEPIGPAFLRALVSYLAASPDTDELLRGFEWWIVPHANPDGEARNISWSAPLLDTIDPIAYLSSALREAPGDDVEFGFPRDARDLEARPENRAIAKWWQTAEGPFHLHASLHGMAVAHGPWFLIEADWAKRSEALQQNCLAMTAFLGYQVHDVDRGGDKGFWRIGPGFTTRPDSREMVRYFRDRDDEATAALFRPSSMETIRALGGDPLTLVSEMPLLLLPPRVQETPATSRDLADWHERLGAWQLRILQGHGDTVRDELQAAGVRPMSIQHQMTLQWAMIRAGLSQVA